MSRRAVGSIWAVACLALVVLVLGMAAKIGQDTSRYLQAVSTERNWETPGSEPVRDTPGVGDDGAVAGYSSEDTSEEQPVVALQ